MAFARIVSVAQVFVGTDFFISIISLHVITESPIILAKYIHFYK